MSLGLEANNIYGTNLPTPMRIEAMQTAVLQSGSRRGAENVLRSALYARLSERLFQFDPLAYAALRAAVDGALRALPKDEIASVTLTEADARPTLSGFGY